MVDYEQNAKTYLSENLRIISAVWKIDQLEFSELLGLQKATFNNYVNRVSFPKVPTLMLMADITGFS